MSEDMSWAEDLPMDISLFSPETLAALKWHYVGDDATAAADTEDAAAPVKKEEDLKMPVSTSVANTITRLKKQQQLDIAINQGKIYDALPSERSADLTAQVPTATAEQASEVLLSQGCVRLDGCLSSELCDEILAMINSKLGKVVENLTEDGEELKRSNGFGCVLARTHRYDMYLRPDGPVQAALTQILGRLSPEQEQQAQQEDGKVPQQGQVGRIFEQIFGGVADAPLTELSALVSDPGAPRQQIHPDNTFQEVCPLYTIFIAMQDITADMGPTVFLPGTHTEKDHADFNTRQDEDEHDNEADVKRFYEPEIKEGYLEAQSWAQSCLKKGDVQILDSRCLHAATANTSDTRRVLFYFTLRNPLCTEFGKPNTPHITPGSLFDDIKLSLADYRTPQ